MKALETLERQFLRMRRDYAKRKKTSESRVAEWVWATKPFWHIQPLYFELHASRPGRKLRKEPAERIGKYQIGLDEQGRVAVERLYEKFGPEETFYDWDANPVEIAAYRTYRDCEPINLQSAQFTRGRLATLAFTATGGALVRTYRWDDDEIESVAIRYALRDGKTLSRLRPYQTIRVEYANSGVPENIWIDWAAWDEAESSTEHVYRRRVEPVTLDLRPSATVVRKLVQEAVGRYARLHRGNPESHPPASRFDLIFSLGDARSTPWVFVNVDTKPGGEPDGSPSHPNFAESFHDGWLPAVQAVCDDRKVPVTLLDGRVAKCDDDRLQKVIGEALVDILLQARDEGLFRRFPRQERCELGVEDPTTFAFGWPNYKDRGRKNLL